MTAKRSTRIVLFVLAAIIVLCATGFMLFYFHASAIRFDYCDSNLQIVSDDYEQDEWLSENGYNMIFPFFGNSVNLGEYGQSKSYPFGIGEANEPVYSAVNGPIYEYAMQMVYDYENRVKINYTVTETDGRLRVVLSGKAYPESIDGDAVDIEKTFVFDVENASLEKLPVLL